MNIKIKISIKMKMKAKRNKICKTKYINKMKMARPYKINKIFNKLRQVNLISANLTFQSKNKN